MANEQVPCKQRMNSKICYNRPEAKIQMEEPSEGQIGNANVMHVGGNSQHRRWTTMEICTESLTGNHINLCDRRHVAGIRPCRSCEVSPLHIHSDESLQPNHRRPCCSMGVHR